MGWTVTTRSGGGIVNKIIMTGFGLFFAFIGSQSVKQEWQSLQKTKAMQQWVHMNCTIETSTVEDADEDFRLALSYRYSVNGRSYTSDQYGKQRYLERESIGEIKAAEKKLPPGKKIDGYHNPADPAQAVLNLPTLGSAKNSVGISCLFPAFGILFASLPWLRRKRKTERSASKKASPKIFLLIFGSIFVLFSSIMIKPMIIEPLRKIKSATNWKAVPAVVVSSKIKSHSNDDGTTYSPYIAYRYEINGQEFFGDQLTFTGSSSSGYESKATIIRQYPEGHEFQIFTNPLNPAESVINPEASAALLFGLIPLIFTLIGVGIIIGGLRVGKGGKAKLNPAQAKNQVVTLKGTSPIGAAIFITIFTIIWNGVVYLIYTSHADWLFLILFGFFGIVSILLAIKTYLSLFNPRPNIEISPGNIQLGTRVNLRWRMVGNVEQIDELRIELKCMKVTTVTTSHGNNRSSHTVKTPVYECDIFQSTSPIEIPQGALQFIIPKDRPSSRPGSHDGIEWQLIVHGTIPKWPDIKEEFKFLVYPT